MIPPCTPHVLITRCGAQGDHMAVHFDWAWDCPDRSLARRSRGNYRVIIDGLPPLGPVLPLDAVTINLLAEVVRQHHAGDPRARLRAGMALLQTVLHLSESQPTTATREGDDPAVAAALACIANHYREPLCCEDLATATGLHRSRFAQRFKAWTGRPPLAFLRRYRIDRAGELLRADPECPLAAIATACGFADAFAFSKAFKAELGVSPAVFRQQQPG